MTRRIAAVALTVLLPLATATSCEPHYRDCAAVRDAGAAPIHQGDPGYGSHLDRDGDGTGCETDG
nr:excalibur calcium-binding domain-containing protein [Micromonospora sp. DSM 115978]